MGKNNKLPVDKSSSTRNQVAKTELGRGQIKGNFLAALVTSKVYKMQVVKAKKGKGSYQRRAKNGRGESYLIAA
ncbi:alternative ribosome rescue factor ArfA [Colwellia sp. E2M01]|uniref:alternative ribosome rescue factor ArfA n=1 Tax=Colwellia sp. E2M01 TaxID=2841561 RepID=UPI001C087F5F|nr:alternative ribosome rescue factor ArfA [Colwellia sp. E2M01]MBU2870048.1 ribosome alternative rescue factor ArfA [Colwellia sp. E2M01]